MVHRPGKKNIVPDLLSRHFVVYDEENGLPDNNTATLINEAIRGKERGASGSVMPEDQPLPFEENNEEEDGLEEILTLVALPAVDRRRHAATERRELTKGTRMERARPEINEKPANWTFMAVRMGNENPDNRTTMSGDPMEVDAPPGVQSDSTLNGVNGHSKSINNIAMEEIHMKYCDIVLEQQKDPFLDGIKGYILRKEIPEKKLEKIVKRQAGNYGIDGFGIIRRMRIKGQTLDLNVAPIALPQQLWYRVIMALHDDKMGGHRRFGQLYNTFRLKYHFRGMYRFIYNYASTCVTCRKHITMKAAERTITPYRANAPGRIVHCDCTGAPPGSRFKWILVIIDSFSGYVSLEPLTNNNAKLTAEALYKYVSVHGIPERFVTDNGSEYIAGLTKGMMELLGVKHTLITPYNKQSNGKVENIHKLITATIRTVNQDLKIDWTETLPTVQYVLNTSVRQEGYSPFYLHYGRHPNQPLDLILYPDGGGYHGCEAYSKLTRKLQEQRQYVYEKINERRGEKQDKLLERMKRKYNPARPQVREGGYALKELSEYTGANSHLRKWVERYDKDIYMIDEKVAPNVYRLYNPKNGMCEDVVVDRIRPIQLRRPILSKEYVERIHKHRPIEGGKYQMYVSFIQRDEGIIYQNQWVPEKDLDDAMVRAYWQTLNRRTR